MYDAILLLLFLSNTVMRKINDCLSSSIVYIKILNIQLSILKDCFLFKISSFFG